MTLFSRLLLLGLFLALAGCEAGVSTPTASSARALANDGGWAGVGEGGGR